MDRLRASFRRPVKYDKAIPNATPVIVSHVQPEGAKPRPKRTLAAEYREKIIDALAPGKLASRDLASACGCPASNRSFIRARQALVAKAEVVATGASKARVFALPPQSEDCSVPLDSLPRDDVQRAE